MYKDGTNCFIVKERTQNLSKMGYGFCWKENDPHPLSKLAVSEIRLLSFFTLWGSQLLRYKI